MTPASGTVARSANSPSPCHGVPSSTQPLSVGRTTERSSESTREPSSA